jgi:hypothetical protein
VPQPNRQTAQKVLSKIRFKLNDTTINKYSNTELMIAMNEAIHLLWQALAANYSSITHKIQGYSLQAGIGALLPEDFNSVVELVDLSATAMKPGQIDVRIFNRAPGNRYTWQPRIEGDYVFGDGEVKLVYNYIPREVTLLEDSVDVPKQLIPDVVAVTANIVSQNMDAARQRVDECAKKVSQFREYAKIPDKVAFP